MHDETRAAVSEAPEFRAIVRKRASCVSILSAVLCVFFISNILLMSLAAQFASLPVAGLNIGILFSIVLTLAGGAIAAAYAIWTNRSLDPEVDTLRERCAASAPDALRHE